MRFLILLFLASCSMAPADYHQELNMVCTKANDQMEHCQNEAVFCYKYANGELGCFPREAE